MTRSLFAALCAFLLFQTFGCSNFGTITGNLAYSDASCAPNLIVVTDPVNNRSDAYNLPAGCTGDITHRRQLRLPSPQDGTFTFHLYNATPYMTYTRVFGVDADGGKTLISDCRKNDAAYQSTDVANAGGYTFIIVDVSYGVNGEYGPITNENTLAFAAYDERTDTRESVGTAPLACNELTTDRVLLTSCDRGQNLTEWARENGLVIVDSLGSAGNSVVAEGPSRMLVNATGTPPTKPREKMKQDSSNVFFEEDFIITIPVGLDPAALSPDSNEIFQTDTRLARACMKYAPPKNMDQSRRAIVVAVIDSGVEVGGKWDGDFKRFAAGGLRGIPSGGMGFDFVNNDAVPEDNVGHGTSVAGTLIGNYAGRAPLKVIHYKVFDRAGRATYAGAVEAIYAAADAGADIVNLSWGIVRADPPQALRCALDYARDRGAVIITTAGNDQENTDTKPQWPGAFSRDSFGLERLFTVGSFTYNGSVAARDKADLAVFSNYGTATVDGYAYMTAPMPARGRDTLAYLFGTSFSAPLVSARLATELSRGNKWEDFPGVFVRGRDFRRPRTNQGVRFALPFLEVVCPAEP